jgi:glycine/D-amino acid oxidase-like deaminating enzyme
MEAARAGFRVSILDSSHVGDQATTRNQGWLHSGGVFALDSPRLAGLCRDCLERTLAFCPECVEPEAGEALYVFSRAQTDVSAWVAAWQRLGIATKQIDRKQAVARMPVLAESTFDAAHVLPDRSGRPDVLLAKMQQAAESHGAEVRNGVAVTELCGGAGRLTSVRLSTEEEVPVDFVVLALGAGEDLAGLDRQPAVGGQPPVEVVRLKNHLVRLKPQLGPAVLCVPDLHRLNHFPHASSSTVGIENWKPAGGPHADQVVEESLAKLWEAFRSFFPTVDPDQYEQQPWAGVTVQAMLPDQVVPGDEPLPVVLDHSTMPAPRENLISVYPGRMSLWPVIADRTVALLREKARR